VNKKHKEYLNIKNGKMNLRYNELKDIKFPVKTTDISKFVKRTKDISINIYCLNDDDNEIHVVGAFRNNENRK